MAKRPKEQTKRNSQPTLYGPEGGAPPPVITVDYEKYAHLLDDPDMSEEDKQKLLQIIWNIVMDFVALSFGQHPVQQVFETVIEACGQHPENVTDADSQASIHGIFNPESNTDNQLDKSAAHTDKDRKEA